MDPYAVVTAHFIDPDDWKLKSACIAIEELRGMETAHPHPP